MKTINERIKLIIDLKTNGNASAFSRLTGIPQATLKDIVGGRLNKPGFEVLEKILNVEALNISTDWLMLGEGKMLKGAKSIEEDLKPVTVERLLSIVESQQRTIENLSRR